MTRYPRQDTSEVVTPFRRRLDTSRTSGSLGAERGDIASNSLEKLELFRGHVNYVRSRVKSTKTKDSLTLNEKKASDPKEQEDVAVLVNKLKDDLSDSKRRAVLAKALAKQPTRRIVDMQRISSAPVTRHWWWPFK
ncbi:hypothetical protein [Sulfitobacter sediminilitoris]|uniref:hypothetical protein n=1 Tax=Sulfitobacter sediminilitoris TaxID=2698830 RepID=UPI00361BFC67